MRDFEHVFLPTMPHWPDVAQKFPAEEDVTRGLHTKRRVKIRQLRLFEASRVLLIVQEYIPEECWK